MDFSKSTDYDEIQLTNFVREIVNMTTQVFTFSSSKSHLAYLPFSTKTNENIDGQWLNNQYIQTIEDGDKEALNRYLDKVIMPYVAPSGWESGTVYYMTVFYIISLYFVLYFSIIVKITYTKHIIQGICMIRREFFCSLSPK